MPIANTELVIQLAANRPLDDSSTAGGARDATARPLDSQYTANAIAEVVSTAAGDTTQTVTIVGRDSGGVQQTEVLTLNGTTAVDGAQVWQRIETITLSAACAGTVTVAQGAAGTVRHTFAPGETYCELLFPNAASSGTATVRYVKVFYLNTDGTLSLLNAEATLTVDASGKYAIGLASAVDDTGTTTNRVTAPAGVTFVGLSVAQSVPGTNLAAGSAIGVWHKQSLLANDAAQQVDISLQLSGSST